MSGLRRYGFRDGVCLPALRTADGKEMPEVRKHKYCADFRAEERCQCMGVWPVCGKYDKKRLSVQRLRPQIQLIAEMRRTEKLFSGLSPVLK